MVNRKHLKILNKGVKIWNNWRKKDLSGIMPDLSGADLQDRDLCGIHLDQCNLDYADLRNTKLMDAWLTESSMKNADFSHANLAEAHFDSSDLSGAKFINSFMEDTWLNYANFSNANLTSADLIGSRLYRTNFQGAILEHSLLSRSQPINADFSHSKMTGALVKDWYPNKETILKNIDCKFVYLNDYTCPINPEKVIFHDKFPHNRNFHTNEFSRLVCAKQFFFDVKLLAEIIQNFEDLLRNNPSGKEDLFHQFIKENPSLLDMYGKVISKPRFFYPSGTSGHNNKSYVEPDFLIVYPNNSYMLVEIEKPGKKLRTKQGHQTSLVTQAAWQLNEWDVFIKKYAHVLEPKYPNISLRRSFLLIIGCGYDDDEKSTLANNLPSNSDIYTYDDLLERAKSALENLKAVF